MPQDIQRLHLFIQGVVQGIGFRPFVYRLALELSLAGRVRNDGHGVTLEIQGTPESLEQFQVRLQRELPPAGRLDSCEVSELEPLGPAEAEFVIEASRASGRTLVSLVPDRHVCPDCLAEMADPDDRRFAYPFINCTNCGPRFTIVKALPYDRPQTTMSSFPMCPECAREYADPLDRRYHAQPVACPQCGPRAWLELPESGPEPDLDSLGDHPARDVRRASEMLSGGQVLAIKGLGGFHLAADAHNPDAVAQVRRMKGRERKPLALMVRDLDCAREMLVLDSRTEELLLDPARPIVIAPARDEDFCQMLAPHLGELGVMLPYTPLHHLLLHHGPEALVMTSGNPASEPIICSNDQARQRLGVAGWLIHDRDIEVACDDSVIRSGPAGPVFIRRARGFVPGSLDAGFLGEREALALSAELKVTVSTLSRGRLVVGRHLGDLSNVRCAEAFRAEVRRMLRFAQLKPEVVAADLHPDLASGLFAQEAFGELPLVRVQHHHAHLAAVMVEHGLAPEQEVAGIILDGVGYGPDGTVWGGEVLQGSYGSYRRLACLSPVPLPGGDAAALEPRRMAVSLLLHAQMHQGLLDEYDERLAAICALPAVSPLTSSAGRLFDGIAQLLGVAPRRQEYEGEAAARLEALADPSCSDGYPLPGLGEQLDVRALVAALLQDRSPDPIRAARFHNGLADGLVRQSLNSDCEWIVLGGGCMVNQLLRRRLIERIRTAGRRPLWPKILPPGDGGLSAGQVACAVCSIPRAGEPARAQEV